MQQCNLCGLFVRVSTAKYIESNDCKECAEKRRLHFQANRQDLARELLFTVNGAGIDKVYNVRKEYDHYKCNEVQKYLC